MTLHWRQINSLSQSSYTQMLIENAEYIIYSVHFFEFLVTVSWAVLKL